MSNRSEAVSKGNETRRLRKKFQQKYPYSWRAAVLLMKGWSPEEVSVSTDMNLGSVRTVLGNLNRFGTFSDLAYSAYGKFRF